MNEYRFGFNGKESDNEVNGYGQATYDYTNKIYFKVGLEFYTNTLVWKRV